DNSGKKDAQPTEPQSNKEEEPSSSNNQRINATPSARRHARENGVDLSTVSGKGNDVVRKDDVENSQKSTQSQPSQEASKKEAPKKASSAP
ncbi:E3 binding domain-containing protein, partial [Staphylococcus aureus]|nr:E3 binding domain-containing protein [Staphylococcus aureus]